MGIKVEKGEGGKFFAVKKVLKIGGRKHIPSVCYPVTEDIVDTINSLSAEGLAVIYPVRMRFLSGRAVVADQANVAEEPRIVYLPPKVPSVDVPEVEQSGNGKVKTKPGKNSSSVSTDGKGEFAAQELS